MEVILLGALLVGVIALARAGGASASPAPPAPAPSPSKGPTAAEGGGITALGSEAGPVAGQVAVVAAAAAVGAVLGFELDKWLLGSDADAANEIAGAGLGVVVLGGAAALLLGCGWMSGPFYIICVAVAVVMYIAVIFIDLLDSAGQEGALANFNRDHGKLYKMTFNQIRAEASVGVPDAKIERKLIPFVDGYMEEMNRLNHKAWMKSPKGITQLGLDSTGKAQHGAQKGVFLGGVDPSHYGALIFDEERFLDSAKATFALKYCPLNEIVFEKRSYSKVGGPSASVNKPATGKFQAV